MLSLTTPGAEGRNEKLEEGGDTSHWPLLRLKLREKQQPGRCLELQQYNLGSPTS